MLNNFSKKHILAVFFFFILSFSLFSEHVFAKSSNTKYSLLKLERISSTKCQKETSKFCPKSVYKTSRTRLKCIEDNISKFSEDCVRSFNMDDEEDTDDFLKNCQPEVLSYCRTRYDKQANKTIIRSPKMCRTYLLQHFKQASLGCQNFLYNNMTSCERNNFNNMQMQKSMGLSQGRTRHLVNSHTNQALMMRRNNNIKNRKRNGLNVLNSNVKQDTDEETGEEEKIYDDDGEEVLITEEDRNKNVRLTNGLLVSVADIKLFYKKYSKKMEKLDEMEKNIFMNAYFERHSKKTSE